MREPEIKQLKLDGKYFYAEHWLPKKPEPETSMSVIALHGWLDNCKSFMALAQYLPNTEILALDMAGHGHSDHRSADASYHIWDDIREVLLLADQMGWQRFSILGHSRGAIIGIMLAAVAPERVEQLVLLEGLLPLTAEPEQTVAQFKKYLHKVLQVEQLQKKQARTYTLEEMIRIRQNGGFGIGDEAARLLIEHGAEQVSQNQYRWRNDLRLLMPSPVMLTLAQARDFLKHVQCPITFCAAREGIGKRMDLLEQELKHKDASIFVFGGRHHFHMEADVAALAACINQAAFAQ